MNLDCPRNPLDSKLMRSIVSKHLSVSVVLVEWSRLGLASLPGLDKGGLDKDSMGIFGGPAGLWLGGGFLGSVG